MAKTYTVKKGDTLWDIAENELGDGFRYKEIKTLNNLKTDTIKIGQVLKLPTEIIVHPSHNHYERLGRAFETAIQDISELPSVKTLLKELEG